MNIEPLIVEKDFWVCWTLKCLYAMPDLKDNLIFRGGTTLSKVYKIINRFSEDIDLTVNRAMLGFKGGSDPSRIEGTRKRERLIRQMVTACTDYVNSDLKFKLKNIFDSYLKYNNERWDLIVDDQSEDKQTLLFYYPGALEITSGSYVDPVVKLEFGCRNDPWPTNKVKISPYAAEYFPNVFKKNKGCKVIALSAERIFWEKATILHQEANRPKNKPLGPRYFRHYYDLAMMAQSSFGQKAATDFDLLNDVTKHKKYFFRCGWAKYDEAKPGTLKLCPPEFRLKELEEDYEKMKIMFFGEAPLFNDIMDILKHLESTINKT
ncbi:MAG: nucleotidyl transferase AbiEii/AbiGii toxin family protein [Spirochaetes bacterium]|nr:nucleotidyl transferase AbiEii/AbiGii toxin family protein [Spirochaetota bacterium]